MLSRRLLSASRLARARLVLPRPPISQIRSFADVKIPDRDDYKSMSDADKQNFWDSVPAADQAKVQEQIAYSVEDPEMTGGYFNPPPIKRQHRDPWADWWDKQERRNFGEPVHEDNDILGMFMIEDYTHFTPRRGFFLMGCFIASVLGLCGVVKMYYPDRVSVRREWPDGLEKELGGPNALLAPKPSSES